MQHRKFSAGRLISSERHEAFADARREPHWPLLVREVLRIRVIVLHVRPQLCQRCPDRAQTASFARDLLNQGSMLSKLI